MHHEIAGLTIVVVAALFACKSSDAELTNVKLGTLSGAPGSYRLKAEASRLPLLPSKSGDVERNFGLCFHHSGGAKLGEVSILVTPPSAIKTDSVEVEKETVGNSVRLKIPLSGEQGDFCQEMFFETGDPVGKWRFDLQRDQKSVKAFDVEVYSP